ncbi:C40 family peptidase [Lacticaseibacillus camelliae]|uniref:C40 family peptidase n=1 Tax=Lacticaseibacillus camelliae TaxID=381742 RepID=UPI0006CFF48E|nr:C40 family peptidase [Lacticaseibacillus camelliae]
MVASKAKLTASKAQFDAAAKQATADAASLQKQVDANKAKLTALATSNNKATAATAKALVDSAAPQAKSVSAATKSQVSKTTGSASVAVQVAHRTRAVAAPSTTGSRSVAPSLHGGSLVANALAMQGVPYVYGGKTAAGVDCSGLVYVAGRAAGIPAFSTYHTSQALSSMGKMVSLSSLQPGDLLFWGGVGSAYHVAIYVGGGTYVHAPKPGDHVHTASINGWRPNFARRI